MIKLLHITVGFVACTQVLGETTITIEKKKNDAFYSPFGKRDPFRIPTVGGLGEDATVAPLQRFHVDQFKLRAILRGMGEPKAMFQDPRGKSHIVIQGDIIGLERATVSRIIKSEVILTERTYNYLGKESLLERVIALPQESDLDPLQLVTESPAASGNRPAAATRPTPGTGVMNDPSLELEGEVSVADVKAEKAREKASDSGVVKSTPPTPVVGQNSQGGSQAAPAPTSGLVDPSRDPRLLSSVPTEIAPPSDSAISMTNTKNTTDAKSSEPVQNLADPLLKPMNEAVPVLTK